MSRRTVITIFGMLERLEGAGSVTVQEFGEQFNLSRATVYRHLDILFDLGYELNSKIRDDGFVGYSLEKERITTKQKNVRLPNITFQSSDIIALQLLRPHAAMFSGTPIGERLDAIFKKLDGFVPNQLSYSFNALEPLFFSADKNAKDYSKHEGVLETIAEAILCSRRCVVRYRAKDSTDEKEYEIDPLYVVHHCGGIYLFVQVPKYNDICVLAVERIRALSVSNQMFVRDNSFDVNEHLSKLYGVTQADEVHAIIRIAPEQVSYIKERPYYWDKKIETRKDGSVILEFSMSGRRELLMWVLSLGAGATIIEPEDFRQEVAAELKAAFDVYDA